MEEDQEVGRGSETGKKRGVEEEREYEQEGCEVMPSHGFIFQCLGSPFDLCCLLVSVLSKQKIPLPLRFL